MTTTKKTAEQLLLGRERELEQEIRRHQAAIADYEAQASAADTAAADCNRRAEEAVGNFEAAAPAALEAARQLRAEASAHQQAAGDLRARAHAYAEHVKLAELAAEHQQLVTERIAAAEFRAAVSEAAELTQELVARAEWFMDVQLGEAPNARRMVEIETRLAELSGRYGIPTPVTQVGTLAPRINAALAEERTAAGDDPMKFLPAWKPVKRPRIDVSPKGPAHDSAVDMRGGVPKPIGRNSGIPLGRNFPGGPSAPPAPGTERVRRFNEPENEISPMLSAPGFSRR